LYTEARLWSSKFRPIYNYVLSLNSQADTMYDSVAWSSNILQFRWVYKLLSTWTWFISFVSWTSRVVLCYVRVAWYLLCMLTALSNTVVLCGRHLQAVDVVTWHKWQDLQWSSATADLKSWLNIPNKRVRSGRETPAERIYGWQVFRVGCTCQQLESRYPCPCPSSIRGRLHVWINTCVHLHMLICLQRISELDCSVRTPDVKLLKHKIVDMVRACMNIQVIQPLWWNIEQRLHQLLQQLAAWNIIYFLTMLETWGK
jgi:hypothetical protein